jgi:hypothetical protein
MLRMIDEHLVERRTPDAEHRWHTPLRRVFVNLQVQSIDNYCTSVFDFVVKSDALQKALCALIQASTAYFIARKELRVHQENRQSTLRSENGSRCASNTGTDNDQIEDFPSDVTQ